MFSTKNINDWKVPWKHFLCLYIYMYINILGHMMALFIRCCLRELDSHEIILDLLKECSGLSVFSLSWLQCLCLNCASHLSSYNYVINLFDIYVYLFTYVTCLWFKKNNLAVFYYFLIRFIIVYLLLLLKVERLSADQNACTSCCWKFSH